MTAMSSSSKSKSHQQLLASVSKTNGAVVKSLHKSIRQCVENNGGGSSDGKGGEKGKKGEPAGLDYLHAKNGLMLSYLIDLAGLLRRRLDDDDGNDGSGGGREEEDGQRLERLLEMRTALEKIRPLEKRMRYQIDKLLALSTLGAGTFAAVGREEEEKQKKGGDDGRDDDEDEGGEGTAPGSDPLSFKPDLSGMMKMFEEDDGAGAGDDDDEVRIWLWGVLFYRVVIKHWSLLLVIEICIC